MALGYAALADRWRRDQLLERGVELILIHAQILDLIAGFFRVRHLLAV